MPSGNYTIAGGTLNIGSLSKSIGASVDRRNGFRRRHDDQHATRTTSKAAPSTRSLAGAVEPEEDGLGLGDRQQPDLHGNTIVQAGRLTFTGNLPTGNYFVTGGTLDIGALSKSIRTFQITGGTVTGSGALTVTSGVHLQGGRVDVTLAGANTASKSTSGTVLATGANTYAGQTNLNAGTLQIRNVTALGTTAGKTVVTSGAILSACGGLTGTINEPLDLNGVGDGNGALQAVTPARTSRSPGRSALVSNAGIGGTSPLRISGPISGAAELTKYGANRVTLTVRTRTPAARTWRRARWSWARPRRTPC